MAGARKYNDDWSFIDGWKTQEDFENKFERKNNSFENKISSIYKDVNFGEERPTEKEFNSYIKSLINEYEGNDIKDLQKIISNGIKKKYNTGDYQTNENYFYTPFGMGYYETSDAPDFNGLARQGLKTRNLGKKISEKYYGNNNVVAADEINNEDEAENAEENESQEAANSVPESTSQNSTNNNSSLNDMLTQAQQQIIEQANHDIREEEENNLNTTLSNIHNELANAHTNTDTNISPNRVHSLMNYANNLLHNNLHVNKITPSIDNLLALDRKGRRSLRRGEYTQLNNGTAVQAKTRKEGRQLARAVNRQRRANNRANKGQGTIDSFLAGYARKGGKLTLMNIYMNNK